MRMDSRFNIFFLSNMMLEKGVWTLLDACHILKDRGYDFVCNFVGKWSDISEEEFAAYLQKCGLEGMVMAHGAKYGSDKDAYWLQADLFILPTYNECFPLVLLEAMQHGVACIASHEGGIVDIIDEGETGYIVPMKDALALAEKVAYCMEHRDLCHEMGRKGRMKFECEFTLQRFEERMCDIIKKLV